MSDDLNELCDQLVQTQQELEGKTQEEQVLLRQRWAAINELRISEKIASLSLNAYTRDTEAPSADAPLPSDASPLTKEV